MYQSVKKASLKILQTVIPLIYIMTNANIEMINKSMVSRISKGGRIEWVKHKNFF